MSDSQNNNNSYTNNSNKGAPNRGSSFGAQKNVRSKYKAPTVSQNKNSGSSTWAQMAAESDKRRKAELERQRKLEIQRLAEEDRKRRLEEERSRQQQQAKIKAEQSRKAFQQAKQTNPQLNVHSKNDDLSQNNPKTATKDRLTISPNSDNNNSSGFNKYSLYGEPEEPKTTSISVFGKTFNVPSSLWPSKKAASVAALDGLRALAIIGVIFYHLGFDWARGGLIGVTVFFVLSGYLITGIICNLYDKGTFSLKTF